MTTLGFTDNCTTCEKCGKSNLKGTYIVVDENNNDFYFGSECVKKATGNIAPSKIEAKNNLKQYIFSEAHWLAVNSDDYDFFFKNKVNELNKKYKCNVKM